jgi:hypothetical protein
MLLAFSEAEAGLLPQPQTDASGTCSDYST